jgi:adenine/guanine phosphoribosyltransferase-like PRPP-binding protein
MADFLMTDRYGKCIDLACRALSGYDFDAIAFSGMSGALIGPPVALKLGKSMILVRKDSDDTHSDYKVEGDCSVRRYVILDDFIRSGGTKNHIKERVEAFTNGAECLGVLEVVYVNEASLGRYQGDLYPLR